jgi:sugar/nucleoside kinase (ribokinase family)
MAGTHDVDAALERLAAHCDCVVIRRGAHGAVGIAGGEAHAVPADPVEVVDTTGAGDCFNAGFLAGWLSGLPIEHSLSLGVICGSRSVTQFGGYRGCPHADEFRAIAAERGISVPETWERAEESA